MIGDVGVVGLVRSLGRTVVSVHARLAITGVPFLIACGMVIGLNAGIVATHPSNATVSDEIATDDVNLTEASERGVEKSVVRRPGFGPLTQDGEVSSNIHFESYLTSLVSHGLSLAVGVADIVGPVVYATKSWVPTVVHKAIGYVSVAVAFVPTIWQSLRTIREVRS